MIHHTAGTHIHTIYAIRKKQQSLPHPSLDDFKLFCVLNGAQRIAEQFKLTTQLVEWTLKHQKYVVLEMKEYQKSLLLTMLRKLLESPHTFVTLFDQDSNNPNQWEIVRYATPGNLNHFDELISESTGGIEKAHENSAVMTARIELDKASQKPKVSMAAINLLERRINIAQFLDDTLFSMMGDVLVALNVKECLVYQNSYVRTIEQALKGEMKYTNVELTLSKKKQLFEDVDGLSVLHTLIRSKYLSDATMAAQELPETLNCIGALSEHLNLMQNEDNHQYFTLQTHDLRAYMHVNNTVMRELNIIPPLNDGSSFCLYSLLDKCRTRVGSRLLSSWIRQPLINAEEIKCRQDIVQAFMDDNMFMEDVSGQLVTIPDLDVLMKKMHQQRLSLEALYSLYEASQVLPSLIRLLNGKNDGRLQRNLVDSLQHIEQQLRGFQTIVELSIDFKKVNDHHGPEYIINPSLNKNLLQLKSDWDYLEGCVQTVYQKFCTDCNSTDEQVLLKRGKVSGMSQYYYRVPKKVAFDKDAVVVLDEKKTYSRVTTEALQNLNSAIGQLKQEYEQQQIGITKVINKKVASFLPLFAEFRENIAGIDVIVSFARVSSENEYTRPEVLPVESNEIRFRNARHPLLEQMMEDRGMVIPNDVHLNGYDKRFYIITGMNCGGKSVYLKMIGLLVLLAQIGCYIPADAGSKVSIRHMIQARIGASDSLHRGVSTFMQEMVEAQGIVTKSAASTLVLIDELGRGTSTTDGFGLAWSISEHIIQRTGAMCLFATHFHELTALEQMHQGVKNLQVCVHRAEELIMEYKVKEGVAGESLGIDVASLAGFPVEVLNAAQQKLQKLRERQEKSSSPGSLEPAPKKARLSEEGQMREICAPFVREFLKEVIQIPTSGTSESVSWRQEFDTVKQQLVQKARKQRELGKYLVHLKKNKA